MKKRLIVSVLLLCSAAVLAAPMARAATATGSNYVTSVASPSGTATAIQTGDDAAGLSKTAVAIGGFLIPPPPLDPKAAWKAEWICRSAGPAEVTGFRVQCANASFLDFHIADCCLPGDHWQLKGKSWDVNPNTGVTTSPGPANLFGVGGRVYNYGGTGFNPGGLDAYVECSYLNGVNVFLADSFVVFSSDGNCTVTPDPAVQRIDRAP
jgi:hypothetical protein